MNLTYILTTLSLSLGAATSYALLEPSIADLVKRSEATLVVIDQTNRAETLKAATVMWQVSRSTQEIPTVEQLISDGFIDPKFLEKKQ